MKKNIILLCCLLVFTNLGICQSTSFTTFMNPVIPGDHPDCTLTKIGNDFYTTGSSFNPTPVIYHSTDLVHWEAIAQPVSAAWSSYGDAPAGGCWGGQVVYYNSKYWHFFSHSNTMYFTTADDIRGTWTTPTMMNTPSSVPGLGYDNSIFIDDDGSWYLLVKNGQVNNWIVQLGSNGQPNGTVYNLTWLNPSPTYPYSWAEGPVMWKHNGYYYYCFARNVAGGQSVMRSSKLTADSASWTFQGDFFNSNDRLIATALFKNPNHCSAAVMIDDSTSWIVHPLWRSGNNNEWYGQGRQGLLNQVTYNNDKPTADYPTNVAKTAPKLPSSGIPWMVPHTDYFESTTLNPEWSFLGYTATSTYSLTTRPGWLTLSPRGREFNTIVKNDGEHNYSLITRMDFNATQRADQAGLWIFNGLQTLFAKLYSSLDSAGNKIIGFSYENRSRSIMSPATSGSTIIWLKIVRNEHVLTGYCSTDNTDWVQVGDTINVVDMDGLQPNYNSWTGNRQGLFVQGSSSAAFDLYMYRDAYTPIAAECPANQYGTVSVVGTNVSMLDSIDNADWALYAGVEFGNSNYTISPDSIFLTASCVGAGGDVEVVLDSLDTGTSIADCQITSTGNWNTFATFSAKLTKAVSGNHDLYLRFWSNGVATPCKLKSFVFKGSVHSTSVGSLQNRQQPKSYELEQNYPNPFNPSTEISFTVPTESFVSLKIYDVMGRLVETLISERMPQGKYVKTWLPSKAASGAYFYRLQAGSFSETKKLLLLR
ncbi:MAG TPA: family 43 glycosylhydrolase [Bacteroidota bacterium]|nr:family 43 glycosylhydrolase [Bacteroidota bacterium]